MHIQTNDSTDLPGATALVEQQVCVEIEFPGQLLLRKRRLSSGFECACLQDFDDPEVYRMHVERECSRYSKYRAVGDTSESGVDTASPVQKIKALRAACPKPRRAPISLFIDQHQRGTKAAQRHAPGSAPSYVIAESRKVWPIRRLSSRRPNISAGSGDTGTSRFLLPAEPRTVSPGYSTPALSPSRSTPAYSDWSPDTPTMRSPNLAQCDGHVMDAGQSKMDLVILKNDPLDLGPPSEHPVKLEADVPLSMSTRLY